MLINTLRAKAVMDKYHLDALVATTPENVAYLSDFWILSNLRHRMRQVYAVITRDDLEADLIAGRGLADGAITTNAAVKEYHMYGSFFFCDHSMDKADDEAKEFMYRLQNSPSYGSSIDALMGCLVKRGVAKGRIGVDQGTDLVGIGKVLESKLPGISCVDAYDIFREIRMCKTAEEVRRIKMSIAATEGALLESINTIKEGVTENDIARTFWSGVAKRGGLQSLDCIGSGPRGAYPSVAPSDRAICKGDVVRFDVGSIVEGYHSDMARTAVLGPASAKLQTYHDAIVAGEKAILDAMKPGVVVADLFHLGVETVRSSGLAHYERTHCGHGNGIEGYDLPLINPSDKTVLEPGMVLCIETPYYELGFAGIQIEDIVVVTENGIERLTTLEQKLFVV